MKSKLLQKDHDEMIAISKRMTPGERLMAHYHHSRLIAEIYQAGATHRKKVSKKR